VSFSAIEDAFDLEDACAAENIMAKGLENLDGMACWMPRISALACSVQAICLPIEVLRLAADPLPVGHGEAELGEHLFMRDEIVVDAPGFSLGDAFGFGRAERVTVLVEKHFEEIAYRAELGGRQEIDESVSLLAFVLEIE
jgi:hypothetical protein